jgi:hypothetical protein
VGMPLLGRVWIVARCVRRAMLDARRCCEQCSHSALA